MNRNQFAVIGHPIAHTMSPFIHARLFALSGQAGDYGVFDISPGTLAEKMTELKSLDGFNITIPHKQAIIPFLDALDEKAAFFHSVNTVKNTDGSLVGYTTDGEGFCRALQAAGADLSGRTVILGAGGAARVMAFEAALRGGRVTVAAREHSLESARQLCLDLNRNVPGARADCCLMDAVRGPIDLLANATPVGMYPNTNGCPIDEEAIRKASCVFDAVYNPNETILLKLARKNGVRTVSGMAMLVWQAAAAHEIWYGAKFGTEQIDRLCADSVFEMKKNFGNLILCGFMGCGKSTVGKRLAEITGRTFVDTDDFIEQNEQMTIPEIFARRGESEFRRMEREAVKTLSKRNNLVIATGGGTLMNPDNTAVFKENGVVILLNAGLDVMKVRLQDDTSRPLLAKPNREELMEQLYRDRIGTYRNAADFIVPADETAVHVAEEIAGQLNYKIR